MLWAGLVFMLAFWNSPCDLVIYITLCYTFWVTFVYFNNWVKKLKSLVGVTGDSMASHVTGSVSSVWQDYVVCRKTSHCNVIFSSVMRRVHEVQGTILIRLFSNDIHKYHESFFQITCLVNMIQIHCRVWGADKVIASYRSRVVKALISLYRIGT